MKPDGPPITPAGLATLRARYDHLLGTERPAIVEVVSWAAGNGDRSENGDYIYGRKRMREIDRELAHLARRMKVLRVIDPARQEDRARAWFGATVTIADEDDIKRVLTSGRRRRTGCRPGFDRLERAARQGVARRRHWRCPARGSSRR